MAVYYFAFSIIYKTYILNIYNKFKKYNVFNFILLIPRWSKQENSLAHIAIILAFIKKLIKLILKSQLAFFFFDFEFELQGKKNGLEKGRWLVLQVMKSSLFSGAACVFSDCFCSFAHCIKVEQVFGFHDLK